MDDICFYKKGRLYTRYHSKCVISVGTKNDLGKVLNLDNGCSIIQFNTNA
jgi:hypothetical protein